MLDRLRELFSQLLHGRASLNKKKVSDDYIGTKNYSDLPVEISIEVAKHMDFLTRHRFRQCSRQSLEIVNSLHFEIPIVKIKTYREHNVLAVTVFEGIEKVSTMYIWAKKEYSTSNPVVTCNNAIMNTYKYYDKTVTKKSSDWDFDTLSHQLFKALTQKNIKIETIMLELDGLLPIFSSFFMQEPSEFPLCQAARLIKEYFSEESMPVMTTRCARTYFKYHNIFPLKCTSIIDYTVYFLPDLKMQSIFAARDENDFVPGREGYSDFIDIQSAVNWLAIVRNLSICTRDRYFMPGVKTKKKDLNWILKNLPVVVIEESKNQSNLWLPSDDEQFGHLIRISVCGVVVDKLPINTDLSEINLCSVHFVLYFQNNEAESIECNTGIPSIAMGKLSLIVQKALQSSFVLIAILIAIKPMILEWEDTLKMNFYSDNHDDRSRRSIFYLFLESDNYGILAPKEPMMMVPMRHEFLPQMQTERKQVAKRSFSWKIFLAGVIIGMAIFGLFVVLLYFSKRGCCFFRNQLTPQIIIDWDENRTWNRSQIINFSDAT